MASRAQRRETIAAYAFLAPAMSFYILFLAIPLVAAIAFSFLFIDRLSFSAEFAGLANFEFVYSDSRFWTTFANTFYFIALAVTGNVGLGLLLAVLLNRAMPKAVLYIFRLAYFFPFLVSIAVISFVWKFLYAYDLGAINYYIRLLGLDGVRWLSDTSVVMIAIVIMDVWKNVGFFMIIFLAAIQGVPRDLMEAARIDGAGDTSIFLNITLPFISPVILFGVTFATIGGLQVFDSIRVLTNGGPGDASRSVVLYMFNEAFGAGDLSSGTVAALTLLVVISAVVAAQMYVGRRWVHN